MTTTGIASGGPSEALPGATLGGWSSHTPAPKQIDLGRSGEASPGPKRSVSDFLAERLTYRDGWAFEANGEDLTILLSVVDSLDPTSTLAAYPVECPIAGLSLPAAIERVFERIRGIEDHERHEWLRLDGAMVTRNAQRNHPGWPVSCHRWARLL